MSEYTARQLLTMMGEAGKRLDEIHAVEAGAGNMSVVVREVSGVRELFSEEETGFELPLSVPHLAGYWVFVTGSGCRNRDILAHPEQNVSALRIDETGETATWFYAPLRNFERPTSEFNSHLAVHNDQISRSGEGFHAVIHAQPPYLVQLSHETEMADDTSFNMAIMRWEPETIVQLPQGVKFLPFMVPGSAELMQNNVSGLRDHELTIWAKHGIMVRSDSSLLAAVDKVEYAETGAMYEIRNRAAGSKGEGLLLSEIEAVVAAFGVETSLFDTDGS